MTNAELNYPGEIWKEINLDEYPGHPAYEVSNFGRIKSFAYSEKGRIIQGTVCGGYRVFKTKLVDDSGTLRDVSFLIHRLVAEYFLPATTKDKDFVIHADHNKQNNLAGNLTWATQQEVTEHNRTNPKVIQNNLNNRYKGNYKLDEAKVKMIKRQLINNKTRPKIIARRFGISHTQLKRIMDGTNWAHVQV